MTIRTTVVADSISPQGIRMTSVHAYYPRFIHSEVMTHRALSKNASSSRAIPVARMIQMLRDDPAMPVHWGKTQKGMQAGEELNPREIQVCKKNWINCMENAIETAEGMVDVGLHKQIANRILEPWAHMNTLISGTNWNNFFHLRRHKDAQPEFKALADAIYQAMWESEPQLLEPGEWHLPYITDDERKEAYHGPSQTPEWELLKKISTARCARVSYMTHEGKKGTIEEEFALYDRLVRADVIHASPLEHQATPDVQIEPDFVEPRPRWKNKHQHGNLNGWIQHRHQIAGNTIYG